MAWACGVRVRATAAVLYRAAVGCMSSCWNFCSVVLGCCAWRRRFLDVVVVFCHLPDDPCNKSNRQKSDDLDPTTIGLPITNAKSPTTPNMG